MRRPSVILFDVNETLIDLQPLKDKIDGLFGVNGFNVWFGVLLHYSLVANATNNYHDFSELAEAAFTITAAKLDKKIAIAEAKQALAVLVECKIHPDVREGLELSTKKNYRLGTLTNSPGSTLNILLQNNSIDSFFEKALSVDAIKTYKPATQTYLWAAEEFKVDVKDCLLIACHAWDIDGAAKAGMQTGYIEREGQILNPLGAEPTYVGKDLVELLGALP